VLSVVSSDGGHYGVFLSWRPDAAGSYRSVIPFLAMVVLIAPVFEEWLFRGVLFRSLRRSTGAITSIVITALLFAAIHPITSFPPVFVLGLAAAWVVERSGRVWPAAMVHVGYNLFVVVLWNTVG
jgi:membrane protease YdiL (CAAX protease family)